MPYAEIIKLAIMILTRKIIRPENVNPKITSKLLSQTSSTKTNKIGRIVKVIRQRRAINFRQSYRPFEVPNVAPNQTSQSQL